MPNPDPCAFRKAMVLSVLLGYLGVVICYVDRAVQSTMYDHLFESFFIWTASVWVWPISYLVQLVDSVMTPSVMIQSFGVRVPLASAPYIVPILLLQLAHYTALLFPLHYGLFRRKPWIIVAGVLLIVLNLLSWPYLVQPTIIF